MTATAPNVSHVFIEVDGSPLEPTIEAQVQDVLVDQNAHLPDMFTIVIHDPDLSITDGNRFELGKAVKIECPQYNGSGTVTLITGEITALEPVFHESMIIELLVRGYDKSHRGYRETKSQSFLNKKDSDLASEVASAAGLSAQVDTTSTVYDHIFQNNQSSLEFLLQRAWRIGFECYVEDGKLHFKKPPDSGSGTTLKLGNNLASFRPRLSVAEQVTEVVVKGWDVTKKEAIVGKSKSGKLYAAIGNSKTGQQYAGQFGTSTKTIVNHPVVSQAEANKIAEARMNELSGSFVEAEGRATRSPEIRAGKFVELEGLGTRFSGKYMVTSARHRWNATDFFVTDFVVSGTRSGTFLDTLTKQDPVNRWNGVVPAIVTNTDDPEKMGRVKLKYPWLDDSQESWWARIASVGGGKDSGIIAVPEVGEEVLVAFEHGDFNRPYVLGGLWNGKDKPPSDTTGASSGEVPQVRCWRSRSGHFINMFDNADNKVEIVTAGGHSITLDDKNKKFQIKTQGGMTLAVDDNSKKIQIDGGGEVVIESKGNMSLSSKGDMKLDSINMTLNAKANLKMSGLQLTAEGKASSAVKGATVSIQGSALTEIKGALVKIN